MIFNYILYNLILFTMFQHHTQTLTNSSHCNTTHLTKILSPKNITILSPCLINLLSTNCYITCLDKSHNFQSHYKSYRLKSHCNHDHLYSPLWTFYSDFTHNPINILPLCEVIPSDDIICFTHYINNSILDITFLPYITHFVHSFTFQTTTINLQCINNKNKQIPLLCDNDGTLKIDYYFNENYTNDLARNDCFNNICGLHFLENGGLNLRGMVSLEKDEKMEFFCNKFSDGEGKDNGSLVIYCSSNFELMVERNYLMDYVVNANMVNRFCGMECGLKWVINIAEEVNGEVDIKENGYNKGYKEGDRLEMRCNDGKDIIEFVCKGGRWMSESNIDLVCKDTSWCDSDLMDYKITPLNTNPNLRVLSGEIIDFICTEKGYFLNRLLPIMPLTCIQGRWFNNMTSEYLPLKPKQHKICLKSISTDYCVINQKIKKVINFGNLKTIANLQKYKTNCKQNLLIVLSLQCVDAILIDLNTFRNIYNHYEDFCKNACDIKESFTHLRKKGLSYLTTDCFPNYSSNKSTKCRLKCLNGKEFTQVEYHTSAFLTCRSSLKNSSNGRIENKWFINTEKESMLLNDKKSIVCKDKEPTCDLKNLRGYSKLYMNSSAEQFINLYDTGRVNNQFLMRIV